MEFYNAVEKRRTIRDLKEEAIDREVIERILAAGLKAPTNDHMRNWEFVVVTDKEQIAKILKKIPKKFSGERVELILKDWNLTDECQKDMYRNAIPKQYRMLYESGCLILPLFKQNYPLLQPKTISDLNGFASIWCCIENIFLAAANEGLACAFRIPLDEEPEYVAETLNIPKEYVMPCYIAVGYPREDAVIDKQKEYNLKGKIHINQW